MDVLQIKVFILEPLYLKKQHFMIALFPTERLTSGHCYESNEIFHFLLE